MLDKGRILPFKVLVKEIKQPERKGSIIIPTEVIRFPTIAGEVVLAGEPLPHMEEPIKIGDKVLHSPHAFVGVEIEGESYRLLNQADVLYIWK